MPWAPRQPRRYTGVRGLIVSLARLNYRIVAPVVRTFPSVVFFGTVLLVILAVWAHALLFQFVDDCVNDPGMKINAAASGTLPLLGTEYPLTIPELQNGLAKSVQAGGAGLQTFNSWYWRLATERIAIRGP